MNKSVKTICGVQFPAAWTDLHCLLWLFHFGNKLSQDPYWRPAGAIDTCPSARPYVGGGRLDHARQYIQLVHKKFEFHRYSETAIQAFCENEQTAICGAGGTSKSASAAMYAEPWYLCAPNDSAVLEISTTLDGAKKRIWKNTSSNYSELHRLTGGVGETVMLGNPRPHIRSSPKDTAHGIFVVAVAAGEIQKGIESLKGFHPKRLLVIGDEVDSISQAVVDVCVNLRIGTEEFQAIWLGNDPSLFNPLGKLMEPEKGKPVGLEHKEWTSTTGIKCLRFDGFDSPNLTDNDKWTGIIRQKDIDLAIRQHGDNSPQVWIMIRGIHPPEGADSTILSEAAIARFNCRDRVTWRREFIVSASLDPGFGGDPCMYRTFKRGEDIDGKFRAEIDEVIEIPIVANDPKNPAEYQIAQKCKELCLARSIPPEEFIIGSTGTGRGAAAVLQREWSPLINVCDEGGAASEQIVSEEDPRPARELYDRRVTELCFSIREFVEADMIRNLDVTTANQLCQRRYIVKGTGGGKRHSVEKKEDMKLRGLSSPNESDALAFYIDLLRTKGINASIKTAVKERGQDSLNTHLAQHDLDSREDLYSDEVEALDYY